MKSKSTYNDTPDNSFKDGKTEGETQELQVFNFACLSNATNNFSLKNKLGEGGFGPVYKGQLQNEQEIAVKRLSKSSGQGIEEFKNEVVLISKLQHRNLVRLLGCGIQGKEYMLIYEFMPKGSLDAFLFDPSKNAQLDWDKRFNIVGGIARGLLYLHRDSRLRVIRRDLNVSNILLDENLTPKISDFGMARIFGGDQIIAETNRVVGTFGYMSPEYIMGGKFSEKSDVFSFGVLILEIVSSKRNNSFYNPEQPSNLLLHTWKLWKEGKWSEVVDETLGDLYSPSEVIKCIQIGLLCVQNRAIDRPTMGEVDIMLTSETNRPSPKEPPYTSSDKADSGPTRCSNKKNQLLIYKRTETLHLKKLEVLIRKARTVENFKIVLPAQEDSSSSNGTVVVSATSGNKKETEAPVPEDKDNHVTSSSKGAGDILLSSLGVKDVLTTSLPDKEEKNQIEKVSLVSQEVHDNPITRSQFNDF
ncbi:G-type lectin S-receptor-like serine/threonine-protein kinase At1g11300 [Papaver somniferum]|uniref:G-type lectin S-receptor-like serine/threonine-protein kinase At1g11300 n=1 Tax=Papaver somniferum TaxID=3469 RepID=UPI000E702155|nr:G-type lectin S-receptor-like serine/threonine-protein kinase At1g11300 [Papaver somniferum]